MRTHIATVLLSHLLAVYWFIADSCNRSVDTSYYDHIDSVKNIVVKNGDISSYLDLSDHYMKHQSEERLFYSILMTNKYKYFPAALDVFLDMKFKFSPYNSDLNLGEMDSSSLFLAAGYLKIAADHDVPAAKELWKELVESNPMLRGKYDID